MLMICRSIIYFTSDCQWVRMLTFTFAEVAPDVGMTPANLTAQMAHQH